MKSRTSSFNPTVFKKDLTRFAPAWGVYLIFLLLVLVAAAGDGGDYYRTRNMGDFIVIMAWVNLFYACVVAQLLFGDLYNSRLCNALHAMPVTRESWFVTHSAAGAAFSLIPNLVIAVLAVPMLNLGAGWPSIPLWFGASILQYVFYFGIGVLCVMLSGNRLGQLALYAIINFASMLDYWLASNIYEPLLHGIQFDGEVFYPLCPVLEISQLGDLIVIDSERILDEFDNFMYYEIHGVAPGEGWGYMALCAAVGIVALLGALALYRKRKLECAGDFVAFSKTEPAVLVLVTIFAGGFFHLFGELFGMDIQYVLLFAGMVVGFFACRMLLERTTRVFRKDTILDCGSILLLFALTLAITAWDPAGITRYMPETSEIESITFSDSYSLYRHSENDYTVTEAADIEAILAVHADCIDGDAKRIDELHPDSYNLLSVRLEYKLKNGKTVNRFYDVYPPSEAGQMLKGYFTTPECVLGFPAEQAPQMAQYIFSFYTDAKESNIHDLEGLDMEALLEAIVADCEAGNMAQFSGYHYPTNYDLLGYPVEEIDNVIAWLEIGWDHEQIETTQQGYTDAYGIISYTSLRVYRSCANTLRWLEDNNLLTEDQQKELGGVTEIFTTG